VNGRTRRRVESLAKYALMSGYSDGSLQPAAPLMRAQGAAILAKLSAYLTAAKAQPQP
jgi:hypothetical protein